MMKKTIRNIVIISIIAILLIALFTIQFAIMPNATIVEQYTRSEKINIPLTFSTVGYDLTTKEGYCYFGYYPQSLKESSVTVSIEPDADGYYIGSDGEKYVKVESSTPYDTGYYFNGTDSSKGSLSISTEAEYYFKVENICWRVLERTDTEALLVSNSVLFNYQFAGSSNQYGVSAIKNYLNGAFLNSAFSPSQVSHIKVSSLDNSKTTTAYPEGNTYESNNTTDRVFLLTYEDLTNTKYSYSEKADRNIFRQTCTTDYARATGTYISEVTDFYGNASYWTRSPDIARSNRVSYVNYDGIILQDGYVSFGARGVVMALWLTL